MNEVPEFVVIEESESFGKSLFVSSNIQEHVCEDGSYSNPREVFLL